MSSISTLPELQIVGWTVVHALWQGALLALLLRLALRAAGDLPTIARYALSCATLAAMLVLPLATAWGTQAVWAEHAACWEAANAGAQPLPSVCREHGIVSPDHRAAMAGEEKSAPDPIHALSLDVTGAMGWLGAVWFAVAVLLLARNAAAWHRVQRLRTEAVGPAPEELARAVGPLATSLGIRRPISLLSSPCVDVPTVIGWRHPVVLFPSAVLESVPGPALEAILAHEMAHVRRHDFAVNLLQVIAETLLFFHPAAARVSARIREEREYCCDQVAVGAISGGVRTYLKALLAVDTLRPALPARHVMAMSGGALLPRARHLVQDKRGPSRRHLSVLGVLLAGSIALAAALDLPTGARLAAWAIMTADIQARTATPEAMTPYASAGLP